MSSDTVQPACRLVAPGAAFIGRQALTYSVGISAESVGARGIHMQIVRIPPGARAKAHKHADHETAIYALSGTSHVWHGAGLEHHTVVPPGSFFYIPADVPHLPYNPSQTDEVVAVIARTDPNEQESVVLLPELEAGALWPLADALQLSSKGSPVGSDRRGDPTAADIAPGPAAAADSAAHQGTVGPRESR